MTLINAIPLKELTIYELSLALLLSIALTGTCLLLLLVPRLPERLVRPRTRRGRSALEARFVFVGEELVEAPEGWRDLLRQQGEASDWQCFREVLSTRFQGVPPAVTQISGPPMRLAAASTTDPALLHLRRRRDQLTVTLTETRPAGLTDRYAALHARQAQGVLEDRLEHLPIPVWTMGNGGVVTSGNAAFRSIGDRFAASDEAVAPLLRSDDQSEGRPGFTYRALLPAMDRQAETWVDVSARRAGGAWDCAALDVSDLVKAELAQRNFVQTLTKTFAQLSTGLAIFDRDRQLILFNPALLDLTQLSPEFLASRPALSHFFDHLRDRQIMPEPKDYTSWREQLNALVSAAADGRYQETWSLASGATYRVTGRPHPNGAVAFLFEDITDHIAMTRRFRQQLSLSQSVLDAFTDAIAIFDRDGVMSHCNQTYRELFHADIPDQEAADLQELTAREAHESWTRQALSPLGLDEVLAQLVSTRPGREATRHVLQLHRMGEVTCSVLPLIGGARMVTFGGQRASLPIPLETRPRLPRHRIASSG
ncbi:PAS domain-containing protein [Pseudooceanicola antarcticus]|uniref:PAS domain-containing protein n=2 Tax=Pseudooceanicola antarcticus TaxID=1247613 RepID=A0A285HTL5_9RHOB|nr:PAS-domain containing protein [Pseudooceanicola antarcticus]SNY39078.1 PAS domain-containing protein [Pseudooceanicola antarcticus]